MSWSYGWPLLLLALDAVLAAGAAVDVFPIRETASQAGSKLCDLPPSWTLLNSSILGHCLVSTIYRAAGGLLQFLSAFTQPQGHYLLPLGSAVIMGVPFEALLPYGIMVGMFMITGVGLTEMRYWENDWKRQRYNTDQWDRQSELATARFIINEVELTVLEVMSRDMRLTGSMRGQTDSPKAPAGFELNNPWRLEARHK